MGRVRCIDDGREWATATACALYLGVVRSAVVKALGRGTRCRGVRLRHMAPDEPAGPPVTGPFVRHPTAPPAARVTPADIAARMAEIRPSKLPRAEPTAPDRTVHLGPLDVAEHFARERRIRGLRRPETVSS